MFFSCHELIARLVHNVLLRLLGCCDAGTRLWLFDAPWIQSRSRPSVKTRISPVTVQQLLISTSDCSSSYRLYSAVIRALKNQASLPRSRTGVLWTYTNGLSGTPYLIALAAEPPSLTCGLNPKGYQSRWPLTQVVSGISPLTRTEILNPNLFPAPLFRTVIRVIHDGYHSIPIRTMDPLRPIREYQ